MRVNLPRVDSGTEGWSCYSQVSAEALWGVCTADTELVGVIQEAWTQHNCH